MHRVGHVEEIYFLPDVVEQFLHRIAFGYLEDELVVN